MRRKIAAGGGGSPVLRRRAGALAGALLVHLALFLFAFSSASGDLVSAAGASGGPSGPVFEVTLVRTPGTEVTAASGGGVRLPAFRPQPNGLGAPILVPRRSAGDAFAALDRQLRVNQAAAPPAPRLADPKRAQSGAPHPAPAPASSASIPSSGRDLASSGDASGQVSTGALWGAIEPCWRNLGIRGRVPVVLEVTLAGDGGLRRPPRVIRSDTAPIDEPRLQAESGALAAIAACAPRGNPVFGGRTYRLEFPAAP